MNTFDIFNCELSQTVWNDKYRYKKRDVTIEDTMRRVGHAIFKDDANKARRAL